MMALLHKACGAGEASPTDAISTANGMLGHARRRDELGVNGTEHPHHGLR